MCFCSTVASCQVHLNLTTQVICSAASIPADVRVPSFYRSLLASLPNCRAQHKCLHASGPICLVCLPGNIPLDSEEWADRQSRFIQAHPWNVQTLWKQCKGRRILEWKRWIIGLGNEWELRWGKLEPPTSVGLAKAWQAVFKNAWPLRGTNWRAFYQLGVPLCFTGFSVDPKPGSCCGSSRWWSPRAFLIRWLQTTVYSNFSNINISWR